MDADRDQPAQDMTKHLGEFDPSNPENFFGDLPPDASLDDLHAAYMRASRRVQALLDAHRTEKKAKPAANYIRPDVKALFSKLQLQINPSSEYFTNLAESLHREAQELPFPSGTYEQARAKYPLPKLASMMDDVRPYQPEPDVGVITPSGEDTGHGETNRPELDPAPVLPADNNTKLDTEAESYNFRYQPPATDH